MIEKAVFQPDFSHVVIVLIVLLILGIFYNKLIGWAERKCYLEGYTAFAVALGVLFTLGGVAVLNWRAALLALAAFVASGLPMIVGSISRYAEARRREQEYERQTQTMAQRSERS